LNKLAISKMEIVLKQQGRDRESGTPPTISESKDADSSLRQSPNLRHEPRSLTPSTTPTQAPHKKTKVPEAEGVSEGTPSSIASIRFFSRNASIDNGRFNFKFTLPNNSPLKSITCTLFSLNCNLYNITESNNLIELTENEGGSSSQILHIPIGYYSIMDLIDTLNKLLKNGGEAMHVILHKHKYKVQISSSKPFCIKFLTNNKIVSASSLGTILGFTNSNYMNNNTYLAENHPQSAPFNTLFLRMFAGSHGDGQFELSKSKTSDINFNYFSCIQIPYDDTFGKTFTCTLPDEPFDIITPIKCETLSFEFWSPTFGHIKRFLDFSIECLLEY